MNKIRHYMELHKKPIIVGHAVVMWGPMFAVIAFRASAYSVLLAGIMAVIAASSLTLLTVVSHKTDKWWYEEGSKETK